MKHFVVEVWGDFACFTRPETKVERLSYPVMTPSAARGVLDAIYAKPLEFSWRVHRIEVLKSIQFIALRRNEVKDKISAAAVLKARNGAEGPLIIADGTKDLMGTDAAGRTQRQTIALKDVRYRIHASIMPRKGFAHAAKALEEQAERRLVAGKCYSQPYLGCREFVGYFEPSSGHGSPVAITDDIGWMVYDVFDLDAIDIDHAPPYISLFRAELKEGVLEIPNWESALVRKPDRR